MNNPFDYVPDSRCSAAFEGLVEWIDLMKNHVNAADMSFCGEGEAGLGHLADGSFCGEGEAGLGHLEEVRFCREVEAGKMLGVLVASDPAGAVHTLFAFSGQLGEDGFHFPGFVGPVFDYLQPDGYFKRREGEISSLNHEISAFEKVVLSKAEGDYRLAKGAVDAEVSALRERMRESKERRDARRNSGIIDEGERDAMIRESQFEKAELHRLKKRLAMELAPFETALHEARGRLEGMKEKRRKDSEALQKWLFDNFQVLNGKGESKSLSEIFADTSIGVPPSGAGECCAPKLLQAAYLKGWKPIAMAEYWYGKPKDGEVRIHGEHYPACRGKCLPILRWMLEGLEVDPPLDSEDARVGLPEPKIIYENGWFCVVDKPSGMLSVPGKGHAVSVQEWLEERYGKERGVKVVHRLDQDTSGLLVATFGPLAYKVMQSLFARRRVKKTYIAELEGDYEALGIPKRGEIELPLMADWLDRPRQRVDFKDGKEARTEYEFIGRAEGRSRVEFHPLTGRTHQLRVHAASEKGLGMPIAGDRLYGKNGGKDAGRLMLHAMKLEFTFPIDKESYRFETAAPF